MSRHASSEAPWPGSEEVEIKVPAREFQILRNTAARSCCAWSRAGAVMASGVVGSLRDRWSRAAPLLVCHVERLYDRSEHTP